MAGAVPLRRDVRMLGAMLGRVMGEVAGPEILELEEEIRRLSRARRKAPEGRRSEAGRALARRIAELRPEEARAVVRASRFSSIWPTWRKTGTASGSWQRGTGRPGPSPARSRSGRRSVASGGRAGLRAIPWVFAWTQSRYLLPAWYGLGTAVEESTRADPMVWVHLRDVYHHWPFFRATLDHAELALAKADTGIARHYAGLVEDRKTGEAIWGLIQKEYRLSRRAVLRITGCEELLAGIPWLQWSIRIRNPYVDPLNFIQVELYRRLYQMEGKEDPELRDLLRQTVQGVASGMRTTG